MTPFNRRRTYTYNTPKVEVVKIEPPKPPIHNNEEAEHENKKSCEREKNHESKKNHSEHDFTPENPRPRGKGLDFLKNLNFNAEDILLIGLILLFLNMEGDEYTMMIPALIYILLG